MKQPDSIAHMVDQVGSFPREERERIRRKYFTTPPATVRFMCERYGMDRKAVLDVCCHYGYYLCYFGEGSAGIDATPSYVQFAREMGLNVRQGNIEDGLPDFGTRFDGLLFSGTLEEILSPHVMLMRFREQLKPDGLLFLRVPVVPVRWFDLLYRRLRGEPGYSAQLHLYFFTPRILKLMLERAGYTVLETVQSGVRMNPVLSPFHELLMPFAVTVTLVARPVPSFTYPGGRTADFLPVWADDLAQYHAPSGASSGVS